MYIKLSSITFIEFSIKEKLEKKFREIKNKIFLWKLHCWVATNLYVSHKFSFLHTHTIIKYIFLERREDRKIGYECMHKSRKEKYYFKKKTTKRPGSPRQTTCLYIPDRTVVQLP